MKANTALFFVVTLLPAIFISSLDVVPVIAPKTITVPDDYGTIQMAVEKANPGDTVYVRKGLYDATLSSINSMYIVIDKPLKLIGEDREDTIIKGFQKDQDNIPVIDVKANDVTISGFTLTGGVFCIRADPIPFNCRIVGNILTNSTEDAIRAHGGISDLTFSITLANLLISDNIISDNQGRAMYLDCAGVTITDNIISNNGHRDYPYPLDAIGLDGAYNVTIANNTISNNGKSGLHLGWYGSYQVYGNTITGNGAAGIEFYSYCCNTTVYANNIEKNGIGIQLSEVAEGYRGYGNLVWNNNIRDNQKQAATASLTDSVRWDYNNRGNFWSDYKGKGDTPYVIDSNNTDNYPLTSQITSFMAPPPTPLPSSVATPSPQPKFPIQAPTNQSPNMSELVVLVILVIVAVILSANIILFVKRKKAKKQLLAYVYPNSAFKSS